jgi:hypothetical protein
MRRPVISSLRALTVLVMLTSVAACGSGGTTAGAPIMNHSTSAGPSSSAPGSASTMPGGSSAAGCDSGAWLSAPLSAARHVAVPPVPVVTAIRAAQHPECGYDRLVLDVTGPMPGYAIRYVSQVEADPSGQEIRLAGRRFLLITLQPAQAHTSAGVPTITGAVRVLGYRMLAGWAQAGDHEGVVTVAVGLNANTSIRVGELPGRLYIDFRG